jgi:predicted dehydrogenase
MKYTNLRVGLAGLGHLGSIHAKLLREISDENPLIEFKGVFDADISICRAAAATHKVKEYDNLNSLLDEIDVLFIVTPTSTHYSIAVEAIKRGVHLFIEKPVTNSLAKAEKLIALAKGKKLKIQVGHVERFNPALLALEKYELRPMFIEAHRLAQFKPRGMDVSVVLDLMIHDIDIILNLIKSPVQKIDANGVAVISNNIDIANARLTFENGSVANVTASRISLKNMRKMRIFQNNAYISVDFGKNKSEVFRLTDAKDEVDAMSFPLGEYKKVVLEEPEIENLQDFNPIKKESESFFNSILHDTPITVSLEDGKKAVEIADEIIEIITKTNSFDC